MSLAMRSRPVSTSCSSAFAFASPSLPRPVSSGAVLAGVVLAETVHKRFAGLNRDVANDERSRRLPTSS